MKKFITALLVIAMLASFAVPAFAANEVELVYSNTNKDTAGKEVVDSDDDTVNSLKPGDTLGTKVDGEKVSNQGATITAIIVDAKGELDKNNGEVTDNKGTIDNNYGTVVENNKLIEDNEAKGVVKVNNGTIEENKAGAVVEVNNKGTINNNYGTVVENNNLIKDNEAKGVVEVNNGTVAENENKAVVVVNTEDGKVNQNTGVVEINLGSVEMKKTDNKLGTVAYNYGTIIESSISGMNVTYTEADESLKLNGSYVVNMGTIKDNTATYVAVVYENTEVEAKWTEAQQKALDAAEIEAKQYEGIQQAKNGTFTVYSEEKAAEMGITKEGYTLVCFEDAEHNVYNFSTKIENVKNPLFLKAVYELIVRSQGAAYVADEFSLATNTATLVMNRKMYTDAELAAREMTVKVNGEEVSHDDFTVSIDENGNILIVFTDAFMATLSAGEHHLQVKFANGVVYNVVIVK